MDFTAQGRVGQVTGSLMSAVRDACWNGLLDWSPRLMLAMYTCDIQASGEWVLRYRESQLLNAAQPMFLVKYMEWWQNDAVG
jgi:phage baseplate assembly protein W